MAKPTHYESSRVVSFLGLLSYRSVRVGIAYRALGVEDSESIVWFWIGSHVEYERLINR